MRTGILSALIYVGISAVAAVVFLVVTTTTGDYTWVARGGGSLWIFMLSNIVLMPLVIPAIKRWRSR